MRNIKLTIAYDGTNYKGWQLQKNGTTIQGKIEEAIEKTFKKKHRIYSAGRTDSGVHAQGQIAHFKTSVPVPMNKIPSIINTVLPPDIAIKNAKKVSTDFHAQFDAKQKHYRYYILNSLKREAFKERYAWRVSYNLNVSLMREAAKALIGKHDFKSFQAVDKRERLSVRNIFSITVKKQKAFIVIDIKGDGFLYNMVRNIVGTLVEIGRGYFSPESMMEILKSKNRKKAGPTAPAKGLFLMEVKY
ncbi:MAG: tRNA pseudouridine(38-40) synthase TruA [Candidatus Omnitrophota bacterium]|nr:tRNA pseudouridine(38-40) synthase TruA [Candidatus Omnitrophota bacterium]MBU1894190.1 tRNA pseudouridine(38-40) synthase TruA [Candidatus Omnitrophota bacterium]